MLIIAELLCLQVLDSQVINDKLNDIKSPLVM